MHCFNSQSPRGLEVRTTSRQIQPVFTARECDAAEFDAVMDRGDVLNGEIQGASYQPVQAYECAVEVLYRNYR